MHWRPCFPFLGFSALIFFVVLFAAIMCMIMGNGDVPGHVYLQMSEDKFVSGSLAPLAFPWILGIKLRFSGLCGKSLYLLSNLTVLTDFLNIYFTTNKQGVDGQTFTLLLLLAVFDTPAHTLSRMLM